MTQPLDNQGYFAVRRVVYGKNGEFSFDYIDTSSGSIDVEGAEFNANRSTAACAEVGVSVSPVVRYAKCTVTEITEQEA